jgi:hypothetical protein
VERRENGLATGTASEIQSCKAKRSKAAGANASANGWTLDR